MNTTNLGFDQLGTNLFNATVTMFKNVDGPANTITSDFTFGIIPIILGIMIFSRTKHLGKSAFGMLLALTLLTVFNLTSSTYNMAMFLGVGLAITLSILNMINGK